MLFMLGTPQSARMGEIGHCSGHHRSGAQQERRRTGGGGMYDGFITLERAMHVILSFCWRATVGGHEGQCLEEIEWTAASSS